MQNLNIQVNIQSHLETTIPFHKAINQELTHTFIVSFFFVIGVMINSQDASTQAMFSIFSVLIIICSCGVLGFVGILFLINIIRSLMTDDEHPQESPTES